MLKLRSIPLAALWLAVFPLAAMAVTVDVSVVDNRFTPNDITINVGDTVRWTNAAGGNPHDVTADDSSFSSITASSFMFEKNFDSVEEVLYYCTVHSSPGGNRDTRMNGRVQVVEAAQVPPMANFTSSCTDLVCSFTDQSSDSDGTIASWSWDFDDGAMSSMQNPGHTYAAAGTYTVGLTVTDNDGDSDTTNKDVTVTEAAEIPIVINAAMSDAWFFPDTNGQGFFIIVYEDSKSIFLAWFTFETEDRQLGLSANVGEPFHRWLIAQGPYEGDTALLDVFLASGMVFDSDEFPVDLVAYEGATIKIVWTDCETGLLEYNIPTLGLMGVIPIQRVAPDNVAACEAAQP